MTKQEVLHILSVYL